MGHCGDPGREAEARQHIDQALGVCHYFKPPNSSYYGGKKNPEAENREDYKQTSWRKTSVSAAEKFKPHGINICLKR